MVHFQILSLVRTVKFFVWIHFRIKIILYLDNVGFRSFWEFDDFADVHCVIITWNLNLKLLYVTYRIIVVAIYM